MFDPTLYGLISQIKMDKVVLPAMQRPFVWSEDRMIRLVDSLLRGFTLGAILLWKTRTTQRYRRFQKAIDPDQAQVFDFSESQDQDRYLVLDGQQRLTSLLAILRGTYDGKRFYLDVLSGKTADKDPGNVYYDGQFMTKQEVKERNNAIKQYGCFFEPMQELVEIDPRVAAKLALQRGQERSFSADQIDRLTDTYIRCAAINGDKKALQVIFVDENPGFETPIDEILEIFVRVNSGGLVLQKSDLLMSLLDLTWNDIQPELQTIAKDINKSRPYNFTRDDILKALLISAGSKTRFDRLVADRKRVEKLASDMPAKLPAIRKAWELLAFILHDDCKIYSERFFRGGHNSLLPFVQYLVLNPAPTPQQKKQVVAGIYMTIMSGVFASAEARMGKFARDRVKTGAFPLRHLAQLIRQHVGVYNLEGLLSRHHDLALNIAHSGITIDNNPDELQRDHIFPRSTLIGEGKPYNLINHYANFHFLRGSDNLNKSNNPPDKWFRSPGKDVPSYTDADLASRLLTWDLLEPDAFERMIEYRAAKINELASEMFGLSLEEFDGLFGW